MSVDRQRYCQTCILSNSQLDKRQLIPKEKTQILLQEYCDLVQIEKGGNDE